MIGERIEPEAKGMHGYIRVDTVHQGDMNGGRGAYHIDAADEVTQNGLVETKNGSIHTPISMRQASIICMKSPEDIIKEFQQGTL